ncbi:hypothetical protein QO259_09980 [Salinicola sp. JS01]|uniref:hypothetical protein n=1 Tax=Salinicola sp. JS01 TaxID=3050071 RepID=UPI00255BCD87|nr:hypothetical protein [Salinicola sp. JS01]WIX34940.1 hypothetical protein QO259_09980 [Salinicola sp. JS01]
MKRTVATMVAIAALGSGLAGCGGKDQISMEESLSIAALSQDSDTYKNEFALAIQELSGKDDCQAEVMREGGGFSRVTGDSFYFIYCGKPINAAHRWYYNPLNGHLSRIKAEM